MVSFPGDLRTLKQRILNCSQSPLLSHVMWTVSPVKFPHMRRLAQRMLILTRSINICEQTCSGVNFNKSGYIKLPPKYTLSWWSSTLITSVLAVPLFVTRSSTSFQNARIKRGSQTHTKWQQMKDAHVGFLAFQSITCSRRTGRILRWFFQSFPACCMPTRG